MKRFLPRPMYLSGPALTLTAVRLLVATLVLAAAAGLIFRADPRDELRRADALLTGGQYHAALGAYTRLSAANGEWAEASLRVGVIRTLRGEHNAAVQALYTAQAQGLRGARRDLALLYLGQALLASGRPVQAKAVWQAIPANSVYAPALRVLEGERALGQGDYAAAMASYRTGLTPLLPPAWWNLATYRLALLRAADDGPAALGELVAPPAVRPYAAVDEALLNPLLPPGVADGGQLAAVLQKTAPERAQLLGQLYVEQRLYQGAQMQFAAIPPQGDTGAAASLYAAYARLRAGDGASGVAALERLVEGNPRDAGARALLALAYVEAERLDAAQQQIAALQALPGQLGRALLATASLQNAQRDYTAAAATYQQLLAAAAPAERGRYALLVAEFHLRSGYKVCGNGRDAAGEAVQLLPDDATALAALAGARLYCSDTAGAALAARAALANEQRPDAAYYLGAALAAQGQTEAARAALIAAADLSPASEWRARAERVLGELAEID